MEYLTDLEGAGTVSSTNLRVMLEKKECTQCPYARRAVALFNSEVAFEERIRICRPSEPLFRVVRQKIESKEEEFTTPYIYFELQNGAVGIEAEGIYSTRSFYYFLKQLNKGVKK